MFFKDQNGFSIMQVIVGAGMLGGLALGFLKMSEMQTQSVTQFGVRTEANETFQRASSLLADSNVCTESILQNNIGDDDFKIYSSDGSRVLMESGDKFNNIIEVFNIRSEEDSPPDDYPGWGQISLHFSMRSLNPSLSHRTLTREKPLRVRYDENQDIVSCHGIDESVIITAMSEMCRLLGGEYVESPESCTLSTECDEEEEETATSLYCLAERLNALKGEIDVRDQSCAPGQYVTGISATGGVECAFPPTP